MSAPLLQLAHTAQGVSPAGRHLEGELAMATRLALEAGAALRRHRAGGVKVRYKAQGEVVTGADLEADLIIRAGLQAAFPGDAIFSEEAPNTPARLASARVWIVDSLDSSSNFAEGGDEYSVSIGLACEGRAVLGVVYNPTRHELFAGYDGAGVTLNETPVRVGSTTELARAHLVVPRREWQWGLDLLAAALPIRPMASIAYKLARVAAGLDDGMFSVLPRKQWDTCAGVALVQAASGSATLLDGRGIAFNGPALRHPMAMVAAGPGLYPVLLDALRRLPPFATAPRRSRHA